MTFEKLKPSVIQDVLYKVPDSVRFQLQTNNVVLAGGCIRDTVAGLPIKDVDIFCHSGEQAEKLATEVSTFVKCTTFAYTVKLDGVLVQYVYYKDFTDVTDLISQFDFRACCAGIYWEDNHMYCDHELSAFKGIAVEGFHADCSSKTLTFMSQLKDSGKLTALGRALAFAARGWTLSTDEAAAIIVHWQEADPAVIQVAEPREERRLRVVRCFRPHYGRV